ARTVLFSAGEMPRGWRCDKPRGETTPGRGANAVSARSARRLPARCRRPDARRSPAGRGSREGLPEYSGAVARVPDGLPPGRARSEVSRPGTLPQGPLALSLLTLIEAKRSRTVRMGCRRKV